MATPFSPPHPCEKISGVYPVTISVNQDFKYLSDSSKFNFCVSCVFLSVAQSKSPCILRTTDKLLVLGCAIVFLECHFQQLFTVIYTDKWTLPLQPLSHPDCFLAGKHLFDIYFRLQPPSLIRFAVCSSVLVYSNLQYVLQI